jgi:PAS domain S-box-containing protein
MEAKDEKQLKALYEETKKRLDELTILYEMKKISSESQKLDQMLAGVVSTLHDFFGADISGILLVEENTNRVLPQSMYIGHTVENRESPESPLSAGVTGWVAEKGEALCLNEARKDSRYAPLREEIQSEMCVPLKAGNKTIGVIDVQSKDVRAFSEEDFSLLTIAGEHLAIMIENARSEERYRAVVESALDGVMVVGTDGRFIYANDRLAELLGSSREELIGMDFRDFTEAEGQQAFFSRDILKQKGKKEVHPRYEIGIRRRDGERKEVEVSSTVILDSQGNTNTVAFLKDITEKRKMEERLLQAEKLRAVGEISSGVAHNFNNALTIILGNAQLLLYSAEDEESREALKTIEKVAKDSSRTVRRLMEFTRKEIHKELFTLDLNAVIKESIEMTKPKWKDEVQGKGIPIDVVLGLGPVPPVVGIASEMREVVTNMIFNAIEAMPEGGRLEIRTFLKGNRAYAQILDTGVGMTDEVRKKVFEPFFTTKSFSNTGLGLSMSYGIVKRFGGNIEVESKLGEGTTFTIQFPADSDGKGETQDSSDMKKGPQARVLVIDDEASVREILSRILMQADHHVVVAKKGDEGVRLFREKDVDIVLTDLGMPEMSGWEVCSEIKKISPHTPVGMITGWGIRLDPEKVRESRIDFVLSKPFDFNQVLNKVAETMESKRVAG